MMTLWRLLLTSLSDGQGKALAEEAREGQIRLQRHGSCGMVKEEHLCHPRYAIPL